ncbi:hypothetical protein LOD99_4038 [Oopsacas minuta]|uniref:Transposase Tc1-like domain-containing protein n=1 Tax=Oopsacas minuta TaxID=111878 RepID=A0AAV7JYA6_9METZ|nr:hypothetical protein LOD99_4038 [Oopsacas minuta]
MKKTKPQSGRPQILKRVSRIVIKKSLGKRRQSTRKLSRRLSIRGNPISHMTIQRHLAQRLDARPYRRPKWAKITQKIKENRLKFARDHENWSFEDWNNVFWSDESPFELFHPPNRQNDRVWAIGSQNIEPIFRLNSQRNYGLGNDVTQSAVRTPHCTPKQTVNGAYYRNEILKKTCLDAIAREAKKGSVIERSMLENMSEFLFMQDGALVHTANVTQQWRSEKFPPFWKKGEWPVNFPDLNPIENHWGIIYERLDEMAQVTTIQALIANLKTAWMTIHRTYFETW